jgi:hypothetical protein
VTPPAQVCCCKQSPVHGGPASALEFPQTLGTPPPPQIVPAAHVPQLAMRPPQPSETGPQFLPSSAQVFGTQLLPPSPEDDEAPMPHRLGPPPPHVWPAAHVPQEAMTPPQPSPCAPQFTPRVAQVFGTQPPADPSFMPKFGNVDIGPASPPSSMPVGNGSGTVVPSAPPHAATTINAQGKGAVTPSSQGVDLRIPSRMQTARQLHKPFLKCHAFR